MLHNFLIILHYSRILISSGLLINEVNLTFYLMTRILQDQFWNFVQICNELYL